MSRRKAREWWIHHDGYDVCRERRGGNDGTQCPKSIRVREVLPRKKARKQNVQR